MNDAPLWVLRNRRKVKLSSTGRVLEALRILEVRAAGVPDRKADESAVRRAARLVRGTRGSDLL